MPNNVERTIPFEEVDDMPEEARAAIKHRLFRKPSGTEYTLLTERAADKLKEVRAVMPDVLKMALPAGVVVDDMDGAIVRMDDATKSGKVYLSVALVIL